jgi:hypothetical protein
MLVKLIFLTLTPAVTAFGEGKARQPTQGFDRTVDGTPGLGNLH